MKYIKMIIITILTAIALILGYLEAEKYIKVNAVADCLRVAQIELVDGKQTVKTPENYWYNFCMKEKGLK